MNEKEWPITGRVWWRESTQEWVLEVTGVINDTSFSCRHTQPAATKPEDVAGLPTHYNTVQVLAKALRSSAGVEERVNAARMAREFLS
jgi:hypothetical protein